MGLQVERVRTSSQFQQFLNLPYEINKDNSLWVPPLRKDEAALLTPGRHPFWDTARRELYLAMRDDKPVGRVAAIIDDKYNEYAKLACGAFGFFECYNDAEAANALLDSARKWFVCQKMTFMRGPLNPSTNYSCGLLVHGFDIPPTLMMPWNPQYYPFLLEGYGLHKEQDLFAYTIARRNLALPDWIVDEMNRVKAEGLFSFRASSKKTLKADTMEMLEIYRRSWSDNWGFSPLSPPEAEKLARDLTAILDPDFFVLFFHNGEPAAGMVALPDLNPLLKSLNGKMGIMAAWHYFRLRKILGRTYRIILFGILPQYRLFGLPMLLLDHMLHIASQRPDLEFIEGSWVLEDNAAIDGLIEDFGGQITKRYRIYRQEIAPC